MTFVEQSNTDIIEIKVPTNLFLVGDSGSGKTSFSMSILKEFLKHQKSCVLYVNKQRAGYDQEDKIKGLWTDNKSKVLLFQTDDLENALIESIFPIVKNDLSPETRKMLVIDNFSDSLSKTILDYLTYSRKMNVSVMYICHQFKMDEKLSARFRSCFSLIFAFYVGTSIESLRHYIPPPALDRYMTDIRKGNYKKLMFSSATGNFTFLDAGHIKFKITQDTSKFNVKLANQKPLKEIDFQEAIRKTPDDGLQASKPQIPTGAGLLNPQHDPSVDPPKRSSRRVNKPLTRQKSHKDH
jgi:GTPase SAR1 family protein